MKFGTIFKVATIKVKFVLIELFSDFVLWTGDSSPHWTNPPPEWKYIFSVESALVNLFKQYFPNAKVLPVMGNHDSYPPDFFPGHQIFKKKFGTFRWLHKRCQRG